MTSAERGFGPSSVFRLAYAATVDALVHEEKMSNCHGCAIFTL